MWYRPDQQPFNRDETDVMVRSCADRAARKLLFMQTGAIPPDKVVAMAVKRIMRKIEAQYGGADGLRRRCKPGEMSPLVEEVALGLRLG